MLSKKAAPLKYARSDTDGIIDFANDAHRNVREASYGAVGNDTGNDATAIHTAINDVPSYGGVVYIPPGTYRVTSSIVFPTNRPVRLVGAGRQATVLHVPSGTTATPGVIHLRGTELGSSIENLQIVFDQPGVSTAAGMTHFVPAIYAQNCTRFQIRDVRILRAWDGIDMRGNSGGAVIQNLEMSSFNVGINIDGSLDSVYVDSYHAWPFGCTVNQTNALYASATTYPINCAQMDDLHLSNCLFNIGRAVRFTTGGTGPWVTMTSCTLDGSCGLSLESGRVSMAACSIGHGVVGNRPLYVTGGTLDLTGSHILTTVTDTNPTIEIAGGWFTMSGCRLHGTNTNTTLLYVNGGQATVTGCTFIRDGNLTVTNATILQSTGRLTLTGSRHSDKGTGVGSFVNILTDGFHVIADNVFLGWGLNLPASYTTLSAHNNLLTAAGSAMQYPKGGEGQMGVRVYRSTAQSIPHNAITALVFDGVRFNQPGWWSAGVPSGLSALGAGWYQIGGCIEWAGGATAGARYAILTVNGIQVAIAGSPVGGSSELVGCNPSTAYYLNAGDFVQLCGYQTSGAGLNAVPTPQRSPELWLARISP